MILSTMNDLPGYEVTEVIGEVFGITVRARNVGSQIGAGFKSLAGNTKPRRLHSDKIFSIVTESGVIGADGR